MNDTVIRTIVALFFSFMAVCCFFTAAVRARHEGWDSAQATALAALGLASAAMGRTFL